MTEWGIDTLFNPGKRHMDEEKRRLQSTREEVGDASGGRRVDFGAGTVRISRSTPAGEQDEDKKSEGEVADDATSEDATSDGARSGGEAPGDETPRARALRRRLAAKPESDAADG